MRVNKLRFGHRACFTFFALGLLFAAISLMCATNTGKSLWPEAAEQDPVFEFTTRWWSSQLHFTSPRGTFPLTQASRASMRAIANHGADLLRGVGIDWGCGVGCLAIAGCVGAPEVSQVYGLDIDAANVEAARANAERHGLGAKCQFHQADSFAISDPRAAADLAALSPVDFIVANPPADHDAGGDGFGWRRRIAKEAAGLLKPGAPLLVQAGPSPRAQPAARTICERSASRAQALSAYGPRRFASLGVGHGLRHVSILHWDGPVELDLSRPDLRAQASAPAVAHPDTPPPPPLTHGQFRIFFLRDMPRSRSSTSMRRTRRTAASRTYSATARGSAI